MQVQPYALENLYRDQDRDWVVDVIPAVLAWVPRRSQPAPFRFFVDQTVRGAASLRQAIDLSWDLVSLEREDGEVLVRSARLASGRTPQVAHLTEYAAYGLALAGRATGGLRILREIRDGRPGRQKQPATLGKKAQLIARMDIAECHLSLWCASPAVALQEQVR